MSPRAQERIKSIDQRGPRAETVHEAKRPRDHQEGQEEKLMTEVRIGGRELEPGDQEIKKRPRDQTTKRPSDQAKRVHQRPSDQENQENQEETKITKETQRRH
jgi:hypothetical protein